MHSRSAFVSSRRHDWVSRAPRSCTMRRISPRSKSWTWRDSAKLCARWKHGGWDRYRRARSPRRSGSASPAFRPVLGRRPSPSPPISMNAAPSPAPSPNGPTATRSRRISRIAATFSVLRIWTRARGLARCSLRPAARGSARPMAWSSAQPKSSQRGLAPLDGSVPLASPRPVRRRNTIAKAGHRVAAKLKFQR